MNSHKHIPKPFGYRIQELIQSLQVIGDSLEAIRRGHLHQFIPLYGQLRALLILGKPRIGNRPLLLDVAKELGISLNLYCMPGVDGKDFPEDLRQNLQLHLAGFPASLHQENPNQSAVSIEEFLDHNILFYPLYKKRIYTVQDIIRFFANKAGGAHFSPDLPSDFSELLSFRLAGHPILVNALRQIADVTYRLGLKLLRSQADFEAHLLLFAPHQAIREPAYIFDYQYPEAPIRVFCRVGPGMRLLFGVTSIQNITAALEVTRLLDWTRPHHFMLSSTIRDDLGTTLSIVVDGEKMAECEVSHPLFVDNDPLQYHSYVNRSHENEAVGLSFGLIEIVMYGRGLHLHEQAKLFLYFEERLAEQDISCCYFYPGQYGYAPPGTKDLQMTNSPVKWSVSKLLQGEFPPRRSE